MCSFYIKNMETNNEDLHNRVQLAVAEADEILHRGGPESYINTLMSIASSHVDYGHLHMMRDDIAAAEKDAKRQGYVPSVNKALIIGYNNLLRKIAHIDSDSLVNFEWNEKKRDLDRINVEKIRRRFQDRIEFLEKSK